MVKMRIISMIPVRFPMNNCKFVQILQHLINMSLTYRLRSVRLATRLYKILKLVIALLKNRFFDYPLC